MSNRPGAEVARCLGVTDGLVSRYRKRLGWAKEGPHHGTPGLASYDIPRERRCGCGLCARYRRLHRHKVSPERHRQAMNAYNEANRDRVNSLNRLRKQAQTGEARERRLAQNRRAARKARALDRRAVPNPRKERWSSTEKTILSRKHQEGLTDREVAVILGRSVYAIQTKRRELGLVKR
ncbi:hypothetical protein SEA_DRE3_49 [Gordonia phage Dre3]|nr:hypothetical protein SEA_DRE3_49 [Gordonia phage Dre3]